MTELQKYLGIDIDYSRDLLLDTHALGMLQKFYLKSHEQSPQEAFARAATCYCFGDYNLAQRVYDQVSTLQAMFASPVLSNAIEIKWPQIEHGSKNKHLRSFQGYSDWLRQQHQVGALVVKDQPISCMVAKVGDSIDGLLHHSNEIRMGTVAGTGWGSDWSSIRSYYAEVSKGGKSPGMVPFLHTVDADMVAYQQSNVRRGAYAAYLRVDHPEILEFINVRTPGGDGDINRKCFNLHIGVVIPNSFMLAVETGTDWNLVDPKTAQVVHTLPARELFAKLIEIRDRTGEPYFFFIDTANNAMNPYLKARGLTIHSTNLCVAYDTMILTDRGYEEIGSLEGRGINVWNGVEFSETVVRKTGSSIPLITVETGSGEVLTCTEEHIFYVQNVYSGDPVPTPANELNVGDKLIKFDLPVITKGGEYLDHAYANGFYSGDGCAVGTTQRIYLYGEKRDLLYRFDSVLGTDGTKLYDNPTQSRGYIHTKCLRDKFFVPSGGYTLESRLDWFAGLCDSDGTVARNGDNEAIQVGSTNPEFLRQVQLMLQTCGVTSKIKKSAEGGYRSLPDGRGGKKDYLCRDNYRLLISSTGLYKLSLLGFNTSRLLWTPREPQRCAEQFIQVEAVYDSGRVEDTYCFTEPRRHMGMFNGILTGQCTEIFLPTDVDRTAVCCLSSLNLELYDSWAPDLVRTWVKFLDNVLEYFIVTAGPAAANAVKSAERERSVGLGAFGWHSFLQKNNIPVESAMATSWNGKIWKHIRDESDRENRSLAKERGAPADLQGSQLRMANTLALAPNSNSATLAGTSPSCEMLPSNYYVKETRGGYLTYRNRHLAALLEMKAASQPDPEKWLQDVWDSILNADGSVQHLDCLDDYERAVYQTAYEADQNVIVDLAAQRQKFIDQGQSINLFFPAGSDINYVYGVHYRAWKKGLKSLYYYKTKSITRTDAVAVKVERVALGDGEACYGCQG